MDERKTRYRSFRNAERKRFGVERVRRIDVYPYGDPPTDDDGTPLSLRDRVIREMVRRCEHRGAANFFLGLRPKRDPAETVRALLAMPPVVAAVLVIDATRLTPALVDELTDPTLEGEVWIELPYRPTAPEAFTTAARHAIAHGLPVIARAMSGPAGDVAAGFRGLASTVRELRLRAVHALPWQRLDAPEDYDAEPVTPSMVAPADQPPSREAYVAALADLTEELDTHVELDVRGRAGPDEAILEPAWVKDGSLGPDLDEALRARGTTQGARAPAQPDE